MSSVPATNRTVTDLIDEYAAKHAAVEKAIEDYKAACTAIEMAGTVMGTYVGPVVKGNSHVHERDMRRNLLQSGWRAVYARMNIDRIASANDKRAFEMTMADPPPLTFENAKATFGKYLLDPRQHILRGLAETFAALDPAYRSHSRVKIGVKGLPKRVVLSNVGGYGSYGRDRLRDILNALAAYQGKPLVEYQEIAAILADCHALANTRDVWLKRYANGNGHLYFGTRALIDINRGLAEFYGDVLPDVGPENPTKAASTAVAKDLQFYWSPQEVIDRAMDFAGIPNLAVWRHNPPPPMHILEPSCGDGRILDAVRARGHKGFGIEYHAGRLEQSAAKGHAVTLANFLECPPKREFDAVLMNPPFFGRHYVKHVRHARRFLKPGGVLVSILPATAHYDHQELEGEWRDLPVGSFSEAGTNVPTGMIKMRAC